MTAVRVPWSGASFLVYLGGLTIVFAVLALLSITAGDHGDGGLVLWSLLVFVAVSVLALGARRTDHHVTAGVLGLSSVATFVVTLGALLDWFGWLNPSTDHLFRGFRFWMLVLELATLVAAAVALRLFRFPLFVFVVAAATWFFVTDLISGGGDWTAIVTIGVGLALLAAAVSVDRGSRTYGFWLHVAAGLALGGGLLWFFHDGDFDWIVVAALGLAYIAFGGRLGRSSWVVLGAWGILQTAAHFADKWSDIASGFFFFPLFPFVLFAGLDGSEEQNAHEWAGPVTFAGAGLVFVAIALVLARRSRPPIAEI